MLMLTAYSNTWPLCLGILGFFVLLSGLATWLPMPGKHRSVNAWRLFWSSLVFWLVFMSIITTLIDSPHFHVSGEAISWMFMISAFLGLPLSMPPFAAAMWGLFAAVRGERVPAATLGLLLFGAFSLGAVTSNMHDVFWCGVITHGYSQSYAAGGDLAAFYAVANLFGIPEKIQADYATFGPCMVVMVVGELLLAAACLRRLAKIEKEFRRSLAQA